MFIPNIFICSLIPENMVVVCLVQRLLERLNHSNSLKRDWNVLGSIQSCNYCLKLVITKDYMQLLVPK